MREFLLSVGAGAVVGGSCLLLWGLTLKMFGFQAFPRALEARDRARERVKQLGKTRYVLIFGICGWGLSTGFGITAADIAEKSQMNWTLIATRILFVTILGGWGWGAWMWSFHYRD